MKIISSLKIIRSPHDQDLRVKVNEIKGKGNQEKVYENHGNGQVLGNKMFTLELLFSLKNPLKSLDHSLAPYAIEELLGDALGK